MFTCNILCWLSLAPFENSFAKTCETNSRGSIIIGIWYKVTLEMHHDIWKWPRAVTCHELLFCSAKIGDRPVLLATVLYTSPEKLPHLITVPSLLFHQQLHQWTYLRFIAPKLLKTNLADWSYDYTVFSPPQPPSSSPNSLCFQIFRVLHC